MLSTAVWRIAQVRNIYWVEREANREREGAKEGEREKKRNMCSLRLTFCGNTLYKHDGHSFSRYLLSPVLEIFLSPLRSHSSPFSTLSWAPGEQTVQTALTGCSCPKHPARFGHWGAPARDKGGRRVRSENWFPCFIPKLPWAVWSPWIKKPFSHWV